MAALLHRGGAPRDCSFHFSGTRSILSGKGLWVWRERACANVARKAAECLQGVCGPLPCCSRGGEGWEVWHVRGMRSCRLEGTSGVLWSTSPPPPPGAGPCGVTSGSNNVHTLLIVELGINPVTLAVFG